MSNNLMFSLKPISINIYLSILMYLSLPIYWYLSMATLSIHICKYHIMSLFIYHYFKYIIILLSVYLSLLDCIIIYISISIRIHLSILIDLSISTFLSITIHLSMVLSLNLSTYPSIYLSITIYLSLSIYLSIHYYLPVTIYQFISKVIGVSLCIYLSTLPIYPSIHPSIYPPKYLSIYLSIYPSIYRSLSIYVRLPICPSLPQSIKSKLIWPIQINQSINQSTNQSTNQPINQSFNQSNQSILWFHSPLNLSFLWTGQKRQNAFASLCTTGAGPAFKSLWSLQRLLSSLPKQFPNTCLACHAACASWCFLAFWPNNMKLPNLEQRTSSQPRPFHPYLQATRAIFHVRGLRNGIWLLIRSSTCKGREFRKTLFQGQQMWKPRWWSHSFPFFLERLLMGYPNGFFLEIYCIRLCFRFFA